MNNAKHTPGPWVADGAQIYTETTNVAQANGYRVAPETVAANARLIAAAPELLAALERMISEPEYVCGFDKPCACPKCQARAAIRKAKGE